MLRERIEHSNTTFPNLLEASIFTPHSKWLKAIGLKLFYAYYNHKVYGEYFDQIIKDQHIKVIHLTRKDILELYVSLKIAERTNLWSSVKISSQKSTPQLHVDCLDFKQFALTYIKQQKEFKRLFKGHEILTIQYEDLHKNPDVVLQHVQEFLGVVQKKLFSLLQKQNTQDVRLLISNYEEVHLIVWQIQNENMTR